MKSHFVFLALFIVCTCGYAEFNNAPNDKGKNQETDSLVNTQKKTALDPRDTITAEFILATKSKTSSYALWHLSVGPLGRFRAIADEDFKVPALNIDCSNGPGGYVNFRHTFRQSNDIALDMHAWRSVSEAGGLKMELRVVAVGIGWRLTADQFSEMVHPYLQINGYRITEYIKASVLGYSIDDDASGFGFGFNGGVELQMNRYFSVPIEACYINGNPGDDISSYGVSAGISFNWGKTE